MISNNVSQLITSCIANYDARKKISITSNVYVIKVINAKY